MRVIVSEFVDQTMAVGLDTRKLSGGFGKWFLCYRVRWWRERQAQRVDIAALVAGTHDYNAFDVAADSGGGLLWWACGGRYLGRWFGHARTLSAHGLRLSKHARLSHDQAITFKSGSQCRKVR